MITTSATEGKVRDRRQLMEEDRPQVPKQHMQEDHPLDRRRPMEEEGCLQDHTQHTQGLCLRSPDQDLLVTTMTDTPDDEKEEKGDGP